MPVLLGRSVLARLLDMLSVFIPFLVDFLESALAGKVDAGVGFSHLGYRLVWALIRLVFSARERSP